MTLPWEILTGPCQVFCRKTQLHQNLKIRDKMNLYYSRTWEKFCVTAESGDIFLALVIHRGADTWCAL